MIFAISVSLSVIDSRADDTCMFSVTADDVPPNIVILLDNGAEMQQVQWHSAYENSVDYTPIQHSGWPSTVRMMTGTAPLTRLTKTMLSKPGAAGAGFLTPTGTAWRSTAAIYYLVAIEDNLEPARLQSRASRPPAATPGTAPGFGRSTEIP